MKYLILVVLLFVGCGGKQPDSPKVVAFPSSTPAIAVEVPDPTPVPAVEETDAQKGQDWIYARSGLNKLTDQDVEDLGLADVATKVRAHFALQKLTKDEKDALGIEE